MTGRIEGGLEEIRGGGSMDGGLEEIGPDEESEFNMIKAGMNDILRVTEYFKREIVILDENNKSFQLKLPFSDNKIGEDSNWVIYKIYFQVYVRYRVDISKIYQY